MQITEKEGLYVDSNADFRKGGAESNLNNMISDIKEKIVKEYV